MKATIKAGEFTIQCEGEKLKDLFAEMSEVAEVFAAGEVCGCCQSRNTRPVYRKTEDYDFFEFKCGDCRAAIAFGQTKVGNKLFPRRKDENGWLPNDGWSVYEPMRGSTVSRPQNAGDAAQAAMTKHPDVPDSEVPW